MMNLSHVNWSSMDEKEFIDHLGYHSNCRFKRLHLLIQYKDSANRRDDWGRINKKLIVDYVQHQILKETELEESYARHSRKN